MARPLGALSAVPRVPWGRRAVLGLCAALALAACADSSPRILDVSLLQDTDDPAGPYRFEVVVAGGDAPVRVAAYFTAGPAESLELACADAFPPVPGRGVDAGVPTAVDCVRLPLRGVGGGHYTGLLTPPPFPFGTTLRYQVRVTDADDDLDVWPGDGLRTLIIGPARLPPALMAIAPTRGPALGGTEVLLRGDNFGAGLQVRFGDRPSPRVQVESPHLVVAEAPPGGRGVVDVTVERGGRQAQLQGAFTYIEPPVVAQISPRFGPAESETFVVLDGVGFEVGAQVFFGAVAAGEVQVVSEARIGAVAPALPAGAVDVVVENPDTQRSLPVTFEYLPPPVLTALDPARGPDLGGQLVRLVGADLRAPGAVYLGQREALEVTVAADGRSASFVTPVSPEGRVDVRFYNPDGQFAELAAAYQFLGPPVVVAVDPPEVSRCGGELATLLGRNFDPALRVFFDDVEVEVLEVAPDGESAVVRVPARDPGPVRVTVQNPDGRLFRAEGLVAYTTQPSVTAVDPARVPVWGGVWVAIEGGDFEAGATVRFDGVEASATNLLAEGCEGRLEALVPPHAAGFVDVELTNPDGTSGRAAAAVEYVAPQLEPDTGLVPGYANVVLTGVDLRAGLRVRVGDRAPRALVQESDERWRIVTPPGEPGPASLEVRNADGRGIELAAAFTYQRFVDDERERLTAVGDCNDSALADLDGDGDLDLVTANGALSGGGQVNQDVGVHLNDGRGRFTLTRTGPAGNGMNASLGDVDGDGDLDLWVSNLSSASNTFFTNDGRGRFTADRSFPGRDPAYDVELLDVDGDGDLDAFSLQTGDPDNNARTGPEQLFINDGRGNFSEDSAGIDFRLSDVHDHDVAAGDLNGDGLLDLVIVVDNLSQGFAGAANRILLNRGDNVFERIESPVDQYPGDWLNTAIADLDGDGDLDLVMPQDYVEGFSRPGTPPVAVFLNDGAANFREAPEMLQGMPAVPSFEAVVADLDLDGDPDLLIAVYGLLFVDGSIDAFRSVVLLNDGDSVYHEASTAFAEQRLIASADFEVGDLDGDGDMDLFECAARRESRVWIQAAR